MYTSVYTAASTAKLMSTVATNSPVLCSSKSSSIRRIMGKAKAMCSAAPANGRKNTVSSWELTLRRMSAAVMPTFCMMANRG